MTDYSTFCEKNTLQFIPTDSVFLIDENGYEITNFRIPDGVTSIGDYAFRNCSGLTSVTIPNSVTSIGNSAFRNCSGLTSLTIPHSVTSIGDRAFEGFSGLTSLTIPNSVTSIGSSAFYGCSGLKSVIIPNSVTSIEGYAFYGCPSLMEVKSYIESPFNLADKTFSNETWRQGTLYVPEGTMNLYSRFDGWRNFLNIVEMADEGNVVYLTLKDAAAGQMKLQVKRGEHYTFAFEAEKGWKVNSVTFNGEDVTKRTDEQGRFTTPAITADSRLNVVYEQLSTKVAKANVEDVKLRVAYGGFNIADASGGTLCQVFSVDGKLVKSVTLNAGSTFIPLAEGQVYIVKIGDKTLKASL